MREMKDSGIEWIGDIPATWKTNTVFQLFTQVKNKNTDLQEQNLLSLSYGKIKRRSIDTTDGLLPESFDGYNIIEADDIVLRLTDLQNDHKSLRVGLATERGIVTSAYLTIRNRSESLAKYLYYYLHSFDIAKGFYGMGAGVRQGLNWDGMKWLKVLTPSVSEQGRIVAFLDSEGDHIDAVIEQTRASIEGYKKLKQAVISQAVTKGIRNDRLMKISGINWVEKIPNNWITPKVLQCLQMPITDGPHTTPELFDEGIPFISAEAVSTGNGRINFEHMRGFISQDFYEECCKKYIPQKDDVYMIKSGATTGRVSIVDTDRVFTIWSPLAVFRADRKRILPMFLFYCLQADYVQKQIENSWTYGTQQNIGMRMLEKIKLCVPPVSEQDEIISFLNNKITGVNLLIEKKETLLAELENYKKAVIFEYVTGKKEVPV